MESVTYAQAATLGIRTCSELPFLEQYFGNDTEIPEGREFPPCFSEGIKGVFRASLSSTVDEGETGPEATACVHVW